MSRVLCVGLATLDTILRVPGLPERDGRVVASERLVAGGGPAATAAVTLARLGIETGFAGCVGDDEAGEAIRAGLAAEGVDVTQLAVVRGARSPQSTILVEERSGDRSIVHHPGSVPPPQVEAGGAEWVHADHAGYRAARALGARLSIDGGNPIDGLSLAGVALYAPTEAALRDAFGDAGAALAAGAETVVVTHGAAGSMAYTACATIEAPAAACEVVSTLGAGDVFHGALLAQLVRGRPLAGALAAANRCAALSCRALDGRSGIPTAHELERSEK